MVAYTIYICKVHARDLRTHGEELCAFWRWVVWTWTERNCIQKRSVSYTQTGGTHAHKKLGCTHRLHTTHTATATEQLRLNERNASEHDSSWKLNRKTAPLCVCVYSVCWAWRTPHSRMSWCVCIFYSSCRWGWANLFSRYISYHKIIF